MKKILKVVGIRAGVCCCFAFLGKVLFRVISSLPDERENLKISSD